MLFVISLTGGEPVKPLVVALGVIPLEVLAQPGEGFGPVVASVEAYLFESDRAPQPFNLTLSILHPLPSTLALSPIRY